MECNERNKMSLLRIIELEQQLKRRDERLAEIEAKIYTLKTYSPDSTYEMEEDACGNYFKFNDVLECLK